MSIESTNSVVDVLMARREEEAEVKKDQAAQVESADVSATISDRMERLRTEAPTHPDVVKAMMIPDADGEGEVEQPAKAVEETKVEAPAAPVVEMKPVVVTIPSVVVPANPVKVCGKFHKIECDKTFATTKKAKEYAKKLLKKLGAQVKESKIEIKEAGRVAGVWTKRKPVIYVKYANNHAKCDCK